MCLDLAPHLRLAVGLAETVGIEARRAHLENKHLLQASSPTDNSNRGSPEPEPPADNKGSPDNNRRTPLLRDGKNLLEPVALE